MLKEQTKIYSGEEGFCLGPSIAEVDLRADYIRGVTSRLDGVNLREQSDPLRETKSIKGPVSARTGALSGIQPAGLCFLETDITCGSGENVYDLINRTGRTSRVTKTENWVSDLR
jgi:hypothetical protein